MQPKKKRKALSPTRGNVRKLLKQGLTEEQVAEKFAMTKEEVVAIANSPAAEQEEKPMFYSDRNLSRPFVSMYEEEDNKSRTYFDRHPDYPLSPEKELRMIRSNPVTLSELEKRKRLARVSNDMKVYLSLKESLIESYRTDPFFKQTFDHLPTVFEFLKFTVEESTEEFDQYEEEIFDIIRNPIYGPMLFKLGGKEALENTGVYLYHLARVKHSIFVEGKDEDDIDIQRTFDFKEPSLAEFLRYCAEN